MRAPRVILAGVKGKIGKTIITSAIIKGLKERGLRVQPFKVGPDFIDPSYHTLFAGSPSRNLDSVMFKRDILLASFLRSMKEANIGVIEGVFGLYDSLDGVTEKGSTAEVSKILLSPIILILDAERVNRSLLATLQGFLTFDKEVKIVGIIVNRVAGKRQREKILKAIKNRFRDMEIIGMIPRDSIVEEAMRYRHLGLIPVAEQEEEIKRLKNAVDKVKLYIDLDKIIEIARGVEELPEPLKEIYEPPIKVKVGVIKDQAFSFYYPENLEYLHINTERVYYIDSLHDLSLPELDLLYIGGGFPEIYAELLERNRALRKEIEKKVKKGMLVYGECGGLIYLSEKVQALNGEEYDMIGLIDGYVEMRERPMGHGYIYLRALRSNPLIEEGGEIIGHEFHHSKLILRGDARFAFKVMRGYGIDGIHDGILKENLLATYTHIHVLHNPNLFRNLLKSAQKNQR